MSRKQADEDSNDDGLECVLWYNGRISTMEDPLDWEPKEEWAVVTIGDRIRWVGHTDRLPKELGAELDDDHDLCGHLVTPGLIDCHTHLVYGGQRDEEFEQRLIGTSYEEIARAGGGILSTVAATRRAEIAQLMVASAIRLEQLMQTGVTTVEIKSGYGLELDRETICLTIAQELGQRMACNVQATLLAAHTLPPEFEGREAEYIDQVCQWLPILQQGGLVDAVDAFCDTVGFSLEQTRRLFQRAVQLGLPIKCHAEQLSCQGAAAMAAELGALSCDHLEYLDQAGVQAMQQHGTVAVLLPGAYYYLRQNHPPPVQALRDAGVPIAIASDHNPGSSPILSLPLAANLACNLFGLSPREALAGMTVHAARALGLEDRGRLVEGLRADFAIWELDHPREIMYWAGNRPWLASVIGGQFLDFASDDDDGEETLTDVIQDYLDDDAGEHQHDHDRPREDQN